MVLYNHSIPSSCLISLIILLLLLFLQWQANEIITMVAAAQEYHDGATLNRHHHQVIIDCDPAGMILTGLDVDDDLAVIAALNMNRTGLIHVLGLTITAGNTQLRQAFANAIDLRGRLGIESSSNTLPIYPGARWWPPSFTRSPQKSITYVETKAAQYIVDTVMNAPPNTITILGLGPLTNIATALQMEPQIAHRLKLLVAMGGMIHPGYGIDLNFRFDRHAASIVMASEIPKVLIPIDTCIQALFGQSEIDKLYHVCHDANPNLAICALLGRMYFQRHVMPWLVNRRFRHVQPQSTLMQKGFVLWDVVALFALVHPEMFDQWQWYDIEMKNVPKDVDLIMTASDIIMETDDEENIILSSFPKAPSQNNNNRVLVPMIVKDESLLQEKLHFHLSNDHPKLDQLLRHEATSAVTLWIRLGLLQYAILAVMIMATILVLTKLIVKSKKDSKSKRE